METLVQLLETKGFMLERCAFVMVSHTLDTPNNNIERVNQIFEQREIDRGKRNQQTTSLKSLTLLVEGVLR